MPQDAMTAIANAAMRRKGIVEKFKRMKKGARIQVAPLIPAPAEIQRVWQMIATRASARQALDCRAAAAELVFQPLKAAIEVIDAVDDGLAFGGERSDHQRHRGAQIGRHHRRAFE